MSVDEVKGVLAANGCLVASEEPIQNHGLRLRLRSGATVSVYNTGKILVQGKPEDKTRVESILNGAFPSGLGAQKTTNNVFVVYGHDTTARNQLENLLRRWGLNPLILDQLPSGGATIIEKLESALDTAGYAVVLATPDDEGHAANKPDEKMFRVRQNVVLELGMLLSRLGRQRVAILIKDAKTMERPSDIHGLIYIPFTDNVEEGKVQLAKEMQEQGFQIDVKKLYWIVDPREINLPRHRLRMGRSEILGWSCTRMGRLAGIRALRELE